MRFTLCGLVAVLFVVVEGAYAQSKPLRPLTPPSASLRAGSSGVNVAPKDMRGEAPPKKADEGVVTKMQFSGPQSGWGIVKEPAPYYSPEGKRLGDLQGGTLFTYSAVKTSSKNIVLEAKVKQGGAWEGPVFVDISGVVVFSGALDEIPQGLLADVQSYFTVTAKIAQRRQAIEEAEYAKNPHFESARRAQEKYVESAKTAEELSAKAEQQAGVAKTKTHDQLRALKYEQTKLKADADKEVASYKAWKEAHPVPPERYTSDAELIALEEQLREVRRKVEHILPNG